MYIYATAADLKLWMGLEEPPANATMLIREATSLIARNTLTAIYEVDNQGKATDAVIAAAFKDATCAQAAMWSASGINPLAAGNDPQDPVVISKSMAGRSVTYANPSSSVTVQQARADAAVTLCQAAFNILRSEGLLSYPVQVSGG